MPSEVPSVNHEPAPGLPPVLPPSGRHIVQMFVVPGVIVLGLVVLLLLFMGCGGFWGLFFGVSRSPHEFLANLESSNPDVRWRAANDLAQVLKRDDNLASDPKLGLKLAELLNRALDERDRLPAAGPAKAGEPSGEDKDNKAQRKYIQFLSSCLGNMSVPVGAPVLTRMAKKDAASNDPVGIVLRRHAVWALANLGESRKRFDALPPERRDAVLAVLQTEADTGGSARADWSRLSLEGMKGTGELGVIRTLAELRDADFARSDGDPFLRRVIAFALTFWEGTPAENAVAEQALSRLSRDDGHGVLADVSQVD
jgi:hypothetical protein